MRYVILDMVAWVRGVPGMPDTGTCSDLALGEIVGTHTAVILGLS